MPATRLHLSQPGQKPFALVSLVNEEPTRGPVGPSNSEVIALGFFHAVDAPRKEIGGHGATPVGEAVAKPKLDAVSIPNPFHLGTHAPSFKRIIVGGIGTGFFLKLTMAPIGCAILSRITQAPIGDGLGLHDCLGIGIGGTARHRRPWRRRLGWKGYAGESMEAIGILA